MWVRRNWLGAERALRPGRAGVGGGDQLGVILHQRDLRARHRLEPLLRRRPRAERRRTADQRLLQRARLVLQQRRGEPGTVAEAAEQRALADARGGGDRVHRDVLHAVLGEQPRGGAEHLLAVALGVRADPRARRRRRAARTAPASCRKAVPWRQYASAEWPDRGRFPAHFRRGAGGPARILGRADELAPRAAARRGRPARVAQQPRRAGPRR